MAVPIAWISSVLIIAQIASCPAQEHRVQSDTEAMLQKNHETSPYFEGQVGLTTLPEHFPAKNYLIDESRFDYEGNWAFCRFDGNEVYGARMGFGRGMLDVTDFGAARPVDKSFLMLHLELMLRDGAVLWLGTSKYRAEQVHLGKSGVDLQLKDGDREIFHIHGWPEMAWRFESDDRQAEADVRITVRNVTILPDNVLPHNRFAMWLTTGQIDGTVRYGDKRYPVSGTVFYDHPRINVGKNPAPAMQWYLYTPIRFADGSCLVAYYAEDVHKKRIAAWCFGLYIDAANKATWLPRVDLSGLQFDGDNKPKRWTSRWRGGDVDIRLSSTVRNTRILKAWGADNIPQTRKENNNIPLIFDCEGTVAKGDVSHAATGGGLAEYAGQAIWW